MIHIVPKIWEEILTLCKFAFSYYYSSFERGRFFSKIYHISLNRFSISQLVNTDADKLNIKTDKNLFTRLIRLVLDFRSFIQKIHITSSPNIIKRPIGLKNQFGM